MKLFRRQLPSVQLLAPRASESFVEPLLSDAVIDDDDVVVVVGEEREGGRENPIN
jgi:hypothetical protein